MNIRQHADLRHLRQTGGARVFFWRNKGFEEHARATGLAKMPQVGVLPNVH